VGGSFGRWIRGLGGRTEAPRLREAARCSGRHRRSGVRPSRCLTEDLWREPCVYRLCSRSRRAFQSVRSPPLNAPGLSTFLVDAQLPPSLARWITDRGHHAVHVFPRSASSRRSDGLGARPSRWLRHRHERRRLRRRLARERRTAGVALGSKGQLLEPRLALVARTTLGRGRSTARAGRAVHRAPRLRACPWAVEPPRSSPGPRCPRCRCSWAGCIVGPDPRSEEWAAGLRSGARDVAIPVWLDNARWSPDVVVAKQCGEGAVEATARRGENLLPTTSWHWIALRRSAPAWFLPGRPDWHRQKSSSIFGVNSGPAPACAKSVGTRSTRGYVTNARHSGWMAPRGKPVSRCRWTAHWCWLRPTLPGCATIRCIMSATTAWRPVETAAGASAARAHARVRGLMREHRHRPARARRECFRAPRPWAPENRVHPLRSSRYQPHEARRPVPRPQRILEERIQGPISRRASAGTMETVAVNHRRGWRARFTIASWCRSAMISRYSGARDRATNRSGWSSERVTDHPNGAYRRKGATTFVRVLPSADTVARLVVVTLPFTRSANW